MDMLRISSQLPLPLHTLLSSTSCSSKSIHNLSVHFPNCHLHHHVITSRRRKSGIHVGANNEDDTTLQTVSVESNVTSEEEEDDDEQEPDPQDLEYVAQIKRVS